MGNIFDIASGVLVRDSVRDLNKAREKDQEIKKWNLKSEKERKKAEKEAEKNASKRQKQRKSGDKTMKKLIGDELRNKYCESLLVYDWIWEGSRCEIKEGNIDLTQDNFPEKNLKVVDNGELHIYNKANPDVLVFKGTAKTINIKRDDLLGYETYMNGVLLQKKRGNNIFILMHLDPTFKGFLDLMLKGEPFVRPNFNFDEIMSLIDYLEEKNFVIDYEDIKKTLKIDEKQAKMFISSICKAGDVSLSSEGDRIITRSEMRDTKFLSDLKEKRIFNFLSDFIRLLPRIIIFIIVIFLVRYINKAPVII